MNTLNPAIGSNQFITKFDEEAKKKKKRTKIKFMTKVKITAVILLIVSLYANYVLIRANYVVTCAAGGHFISKQNCDDIAQAKFDSTQLSQAQNQLQELTNNQDILR